MRRSFLLLALACPAFTQTPAPLFDKPPADVDDAVRARATEFYKLHVEKKFRQAEALVADDAKDLYYAANKDVIRGFRLQEIVYSDNYKKAKVTVVGKMLVKFGIGFAEPRLMDVPFPSYWKLENGKWVFYYYIDPNRMTPFGQQKAPAPGSKAESALNIPPVDLSTIAQGVKPDRTNVKLGTTEERVELTNSLPGNVTLALDQKEYSGITAKLNKTELKSGETAVLTITPASPAGRARTNVGVIVQPSNQFIQVKVE
jgi:hypothetical protein